MECGKKFRTTNAAHKASINGCPKCGGVDIDVDSKTVDPSSERGQRFLTNLKDVYVDLTGPKEDQS